MARRLRGDAGRGAQICRIVRQVTTSSEVERTEAARDAQARHSPPREHDRSTAERADVSAIGQLLPGAYEELRRLAAAYLRGERAEHTLQPTALVHEAYLTLLAQRRIDWESPSHFVGIFARIMRQTLRNHAVAKHSLKRGGSDRMRVMVEYYESQKIDVPALDHALQALEKQDERQARIVELRFFGGLTVDEIARVLGISPATVKREWVIAKIWLRRELSADL